MWKKNWPIFVLVSLLLMMLVCLSSKKTPNTPAQSFKVIPHQTIEEWKIPNGGYGRIILIPPDYLNDSDLVSLGLTLKSENTLDRNSFVYVFTDRELSKTPRRSLADLSEKQWKAYCSSNVASYEKKGNNGYHVYTYCLKGLCHDDKQVVKLYHKINY